MPESYKRLGAVAPADDKEKLLYVTPDSTQSLVSNITVTNRSSSSASFDINVYESGVTQQSDLDDTGLPPTFVAVANYSAAAASSTDGITWTARTLPSSTSWQSVTYGDGTFVVVSDSEAAASSTDGITWTARTLPSSATWLSVTYGDGTFFAVALSSAAAASSTDGITWTARTLPSSAGWHSVTYAEDIQPYSSPSLNNLYKSSLISPNETQILEPGIALSASASIVAKDNSGGNLTFSTYGVELS